METKPVVDMLERPVVVGDYVVSYNHIYQVEEVYSRRIGSGIVKMILLDKSKTTKSVKKSAHEVCLIDKNDVLVWKLKRGY